MTNRSTSVDVDPESCADVTGDSMSYFMKRSIDLLDMQAERSDNVFGLNRRG